MCDSRRFVDVQAYMRACADRDGFRARLRDVSAVLQEKMRVQEEAAKQWKATEWIVARGDSDEVPEVLRWSGQVSQSLLVGWGVGVLGLGAGLSSVAHKPFTLYPRHFIIYPRP